MTEECQQITWPPSANVGPLRPCSAFRRTECHAKHKLEDTAIFVPGLNRNIVFRARPKRRVPYPCHPLDGGAPRENLSPRQSDQGLLIIGLHNRYSPVSHCATKPKLER